MNARKALFLREWSIVRRIVQIGIALIALGVGFLFVACQPADRYRLLAETALLRSVIFPGALALGSALAWVSFVRELRSGTWDAWLLLPRSRRVLAGTKLAVGLASVSFAIAIPIVLLFVGLRFWGATGGPSISVADLLLRSVLTQGVIVGLVAYLAAANSALMARAGHVAFFAPLLLPVFATTRFFVGDQSSSTVPDAWIALALAGAIIVLVISLVVSVERFGRAPSASELSLRTLLATPATTIVVLIVGLVASEAVTRFTPRSPKRQVATNDDDERRTTGIDGSGHIVTRRGRGRDLVSMYQMRELAKIEEPRGARLWTPSFSSSHLQIFPEHEHDDYVAYDGTSGEYLGCIGSDGLAPGSERCAAFASAPVTMQHGDGAFVLTPRTIDHLDDDGHLSSRLRGDVRGAVYMGSLPGSGDEGIVAAVDDGITIIVAEEVGSADVEDDGEAVALPTPRQTSCRGLVSPGERVDEVAVERDFIAVGLSFVDSPNQSELAVCRDGVVTERRILREDTPAYEVPASWTARRWLIAITTGPLLSEAKRRLAGAPRRYIVADDGDRSSPLASLACAALLTLVAAGFVIRYGKRSGGNAIRLWWLLPGLVLGPGYVLACALVVWRKPRWASIVG